MRALLAAALLVPGLAQAQSLGEYARQQAEKRRQEQAAQAPQAPEAPKAAAQGKKEDAAKSHPCARGDAGWTLEKAPAAFEYFVDVRETLEGLVAKNPVPLPDKPDPFDLNQACADERDNTLFERCGAEVDVRYLRQSKIVKLGDAWKFSPGAGASGPLNERVVASARQAICDAHKRRHELRGQVLARREAEAKSEQARDAQREADSAARGREAARMRQRAETVVGPLTAEVPTPAAKPDPCAAPCAAIFQACGRDMGASLPALKRSACTAAMAEHSACSNSCR